MPSSWELMLMSNCGRALSRGIKKCKNKEEGLPSVCRFASHVPLGQAPLGPGSWREARSSRCRAVCPFSTHPRKVFLLVANPLLARTFPQATPAAELLVTALRRPRTRFLLISCLSWEGTLSSSPQYCPFKVFFLPPGPCRSNPVCNVFLAS